jgi:beta-carotene hydroxylase
VGHPNISLEHLSPADRARFKRLTSPPLLAWPTLILSATQIGLMVAAYGLCFAGVWPLWLGMLVNALAAYLAFSTGHDSIHRAISSNKRFNDAVGHLGLGVVLPYVDLGMFRWAHSRHHRFANASNDPDYVLHGVWWSLPLRWMSIDLLYVIHAFRHNDKVSQPYLRNSLIRAATFIAVVAALIHFGYGLHVLMLWFIPSRIGLMALGFVFFWLPHAPHDVTQQENFTRSTTVRLGHEWLLSPILQYQNYHLIHHLYPLTPFYNNRKVYQLIEPALRRCDMAIQYDFAIRPRIHTAGA